MTAYHYGDDWTVTDPGPSGKRAAFCHRCRVTVAKARPLDLVAHMRRHELQAHAETLKLEPVSPSIR